MAQLRVFVAVTVPPAVREIVSAATVRARRQAGQVARWTDPAGWHLTLAFLGHVDESRLEPIGAALERATAGHAAFDLSLPGTAGMFGRRVLWAAIDDAPPLARLARDVTVALEPLGFTGEDRPFHPHLTLARARARLPPRLATHYAAPPCTWPVREIVLMQSRLGREGARYEVHERWRLQPSG